MLKTTNSTIAPIAGWCKEGKPFQSSYTYSTSRGTTEYDNDDPAEVYVRVSSLAPDLDLKGEEALALELWLWGCGGRAFPWGGGFSMGWSRARGTPQGGPQAAPRALNMLPKPIQSKSYDFRVNLGQKI